MPPVAVGREGVGDIKIYGAFAKLALGYRDSRRYDDAGFLCDRAYRVAAGFIQIEFREQRGVEVRWSNGVSCVSGFDLGQ